MNRDLNLKLTSRILGWLLFVLAFFLIFPIVVALLYGESESIPSYLVAILVAVVLGTVGVLLGRDAKPNVGKREGAVIVTSTWLIYTLIGSFPFGLNSYFPNFTDAFFETLSGFTTTGISILDNIESLPYNLLFWRSMTHWIGGLGIIVIFLAILPMIGGTGYQLFTSEGTTPMKEKIHPRINETAKILFLVYAGLTILCAIALKLAGMTLFDALNHAFSIISTGGFSTKQLSIGYYNSPLIEYIIIFFMFCSGVNFTLYYFLVKLNWLKIKKNEELKYYTVILLASVLIIFFAHIQYDISIGKSDIEYAFRSSLFVVTSCITSTGLCTEDYTLWQPYTWVILLVLMVSGASTYSTSGGLKISRIVIMAKFCYYEFKRQLHPNAIFPVRFNGQMVRDDLIMRILGYSMVYLIIIIVGSFVLSISGLGFEESISGMITCMSDIGLGLGKLGPTHSFSEIPIFSKWFLSLVMLIGRLEIYSVILLVTPAFWKK